MLRSRLDAAPRPHVALVAVSTLPVDAFMGVWACIPRVGVVVEVES